MTHKRTMTSLLCASALMLGLSACSDNKAPSSEKTAGGDAFLVQADVTDSAAVKAMLEEVGVAFSGRLDILVNCAIAIPDPLTVPGPFWQKPLEMTGLLDVGLRSTYVASHCAAGLLIAARGLTGTDHVDGKESDQ